MAFLSNPSRRSRPWFRYGLGAIWFLALFLRFWGLSRFNTLVFDEVYFAKFANHYLTQTVFFDGHPPLSKYFIALGIWLGQHVFPVQTPQNDLTGSWLSPFSYRWMNALIGSFIPLVMAGIAYELSRRPSYALLTGLLATLDGLLLVESRYALTNVYLVLFGLLGQWFLLMALQTPATRSPRGRLLDRSVKLIMAGCCFGAAVSVKWNGLWFLFGAYAVWIWAWISYLGSHSARSTSPYLSPLHRFTRLNLGSMVGFLGVIPVLLYTVIWIPHLQLDPQYNFWEMQKQLLSYHQRVGGNDPSVHPYCSPWYSWPWMIRPVLYVYESVRHLSDPVPPPKPVPPEAVQYIYDVHAMGNPILWWLSTTAIVALALTLLQQGLERVFNRKSDGTTVLLQPDEVWIAGYLLLNYATNLLPWTRITRCTFLYHYLGAYLFAILAVAWLLDRWLQAPLHWQRMLALWISLTIAIAFCFWLPVYLGLPLSPVDLQLRRWLPTW